MSAIRPDSSLVARGFDRNRDGRVSDDLRIEAPGLDSNQDAHVSVEELASALAADRVVISNRAVVAGQAAVARELPEIKSLLTIHRLSADALGYFGTGNSQYPGVRYQSEYRDSSGELRTRYNYGQAIADLRVRLSAIQSLASSYDDFQSRTIARMADMALSQNNWDHAFDNGTAQSRYAALFATIQNISQLSMPPAHPSDTEKSMNGSVNAARDAVRQLESALLDPGVRTAQGRTQSRVSDLRKQVEAIPMWQKVLLVGLARKSHLEGQIRDLQGGLQTLEKANPKARMEELATTAARAYELGQRGAQAQDIGAAQKYADEAAPVTREARTIGIGARNEADTVQKLLRTLSR